MGFQHNLVKRGARPQGDEYFETLETRMRKGFPGTLADAEPRPKTSVVAPATGSTAPKKGTLTRTQVQLAKRLGLTPQQYAKQVALDMRNNNG